MFERVAIISNNISKLGLIYSNIVGIFGIDVRKIATNVRMGRNETMTHTTGRTQAKLRITRRGRVVLGLIIAICVATVVAIGVFSGGSYALASAHTQNETVEFTYVAAMPGDSLWSLATRLAPEADPRDVIADIKRLNQIESSELLVGQELAIPLKYSSE